MDEFLKKLRAPTMTVHDLPSGGDRQLEHAATELDTETGDAAYTPPLPVPIGRPIIRGEGMRGAGSEVWLVNPPATLPGVGLLVAGGSAEKGSQFPINSIRVDNLTSQWMYFPENGVFVPPFWYGRVFRFDGSRVQRVKFETPTGITALAASATNVARVVFSEEYWDEQAGSSSSLNMAPTTTGAPPIAVSIVDEVSGLFAEVILPADALAQQDGIATVTQLEGFNGATWDRFRIPNVFKQINNVALGAGSTATVWTPATGKRPRLMGWVVDGVSGLVDAAITFFETNTSGTFMGDAGYIAGLTSPAPFSYGPGGPIVSVSSAVIVAFSSTAVTFRGTLFGTEE